METERASRKRYLKMGLLTGVLGLSLWAMPAAWSAADHTYEHLKLLVDVLQYIKENYVTEVDTQKLMYGAASGMVKTLDPFSQFMEPEIHKEMKTETEGQFGGLGIRIQMRDNWLTVITPVPGTPAFRAGVLPGDRIIKIETKTTQDISIGDALKKLRGEPGTKVSITVAREEDGKWTTKDFTLTREVIRLESVKYKMLRDKTGYLSIADFNAHTTDDMRKGLKDLKSQGMETFVLDLRYNPGGLLSSAVDVSSFFLDDGKMVVYTQGRRSDSRQEFRAQGDGPYRDVPMTVLVNAGSASGSEIVAGSLQDQKRAVILGARTFGKASVQSVIPLADGSGLRLTVAHYYTPSGKDIMRDEEGKTGGITPDIEIAVPRDVENKLQQQADEIFEPGKDARSTVKKEDQVKDEVLERALELLKAREVLGRLNTGVSAAVPKQDKSPVATP